MPDREQTISRFENWIKSCPFKQCAFCRDGKCYNPIYHDAITLLNGEDPIEPKIYSPKSKTVWSNWYVCGSCENPVDPGDKYCRHCGKAIKWDKPIETEVPQEAVEGAKQNEERLLSKAREDYDKQIAELQARIEWLKAEIAKMPPLDYEKLAKNPPAYPVKFRIACGVEPTKENADE